MTYLVQISRNNAEQPQWFKDKFHDIIFGKSSIDAKPWIWHWNDTYEHKVRLIQGKIHVEFESEEMYTWFILSA